MPKEGISEFTYKVGNYPVLLSAPHASAHTRNLKAKQEDEFTGALVLLLATMTGAHAIYASHKSSSDPNSVKDGLYKENLSKVIVKNKIVFVVDIHGADENRPFGIAIGTMKGSSCPETLRIKIINSFQKHGLSKDAKEPLMRIDIDRTFPAASNETVTKYIWNKHKIPVIQIEINAHLRIVERMPSATTKKPFKGDAEKILRTINSIKEVIFLGGDFATNV